MQLFFVNLQYAAHRHKAVLQCYPLKEKCCIQLHYMIYWVHNSHKITSKYMYSEQVLWWNMAKVSRISLQMLVTHREISCCEFVAPSTVKGDAPVRSSYVRTPTLHQSTACNSINSAQWLKRSLLLKKKKWTEFAVHFLLPSGMCSIFPLFAHVH